jgi:hypothetical protein
MIEQEADLLPRMPLRAFIIYALCAARSEYPETDAFTCIVRRFFVLDMQVITCLFGLKR